MCCIGLGQRQTLEMVYIKSKTMNFSDVSVIVLVQGWIWWEVLNSERAPTAASRFRLWIVHHRKGAPDHLLCIVHRRTFDQLVAAAVHHYLRTVLDKDPDQIEEEMLNTSRSFETCHRQFKACAVTYHRLQLLLDPCRRCIGNRSSLRPAPISSRRGCCH